MKIAMKTMAAALMAAAAGIAAGGDAHAFPDRPVTIIVPFAPGGGTDVLARLVGQKMSDILGKQFVIDNRPGAAGTLGVDHAARAEPNGYSMVLVNALAHTASVNLQNDIKYDAVNSFAPIGGIGTIHYTLLVNPNFPAQDYAAFVKLVRGAPGKFNFASSGIGSAPHLAMELFKRTAGLDIVHIPYKGGGPALNDMVAGVVPMGFESSGAAQLVKAGKLKALAITGRKRSEAFPDLPTFAEAGQPDFDVSGYWGLLAPAGVPAAIVAILNKALVQTVNDPVVSAKLKAQGIVPAAGTPEDYGAVLKSEAAKWARVIKEANIKP